MISSCLAINWELNNIYRIDNLPWEPEFLPKCNLCLTRLRNCAMLLLLLANNSTSSNQCSWPTLNWALLKLLNQKSSPANYCWPKLRVNSLVTAVLLMSRWAISFTNSIVRRWILALLTQLSFQTCYLPYWLGPRCLIIARMKTPSLTPRLRWKVCNYNLVAVRKG